MITYISFNEFRLNFIFIDCSCQNITYCDPGCFVYKRNERPLKAKIKTNPSHSDSFNNQLNCHQGHYQ